MKCCDFDNEEFPTEITRLANKQLTTIKHRLKAIFYKQCWLLIKSHISDVGTKINNNIMRMYRVTVKRGLLDYKTRLYVKIWFFWWFLEGYTTRTKDVAFEQARIYEKEFKISIDQVKLNV